jgi:hypothetical protein
VDGGRSAQGARHTRSVGLEQARATRHHELGSCLVLRDGEPSIQSAGNVYRRLYDASIKHSDAAHRVVWRRMYGPIPEGPDGKPLEVDHPVRGDVCEGPDHLMLRTRRLVHARPLTRVAHASPAAASTAAVASMRRASCLAAGIRCMRARLGQDARPRDLLNCASSRMPTMCCRSGSGSPWRRACCRSATSVRASTSDSTPVQ